MRSRVKNSFKASHESLGRSVGSMDGAVLGWEGGGAFNEVQQLEKEFKMNLSDFEEEVQEEVTYILVKLLEYPSTHAAQEHQHANRLGIYDLKPADDTECEGELEGSKVFCKDCGLAVQAQSIPLCTSFDRFPKMGIAAYLYFQNIKNLMVLLVLLGGFYCSYALYTNISEPSSALSLDNFIRKLSFASTLQNLVVNAALYDAMLMEGWLVVAGVLLWWVALFLMKRTAIRQERMVDDETVTAADFSIMLEHVPVTLTKGALQKELDLYYDDLKDLKHMHGRDQLRPFVIRKFCKAVPFYFLDDEAVKEQIEDLEQQISDQREAISELVEEVKGKGKFTTGAQGRKKMYADYLKLCSERAQKERELRDLSKNFNCLDNEGLTTAAFVTFELSESANAIEAANPRGFAAKLRYYLSCCSSGIYFLSSIGVTTCRAPEPEDIIWENIGIPDCSIVLRKLLTYLVTAVLLGASFGIAYGLTMLQLSYSNAVLSMGISVSITVINIVIGIAIRRLTVYESDITSTQRQAGLAIKSVFAQLINSTLVPVVTNVYIERNLYDPDGLVYDIFFLSLTSALLPPLLKLLDLPFRLKQLALCFYADPHEKLALSQKELNGVYELAEFELGVAYIYFIDLFYFTCFYVFVHPCVVLFSLLGFAIMYWAQKHALLSRSRRPTPSSSVLNETMGQLVGFGPCVLSLGQFIWFNLIREDYHNFSSGTYVSHLAALGCSALFFLLPFNVIFNAFCSLPDEEDLVYDHARPQLTSDYDMLNPVTADEALDEFLSNNKQKGAPDVVNALTVKVKAREKSGVVKVPRRSNQPTEESILEASQQMHFLPEVSVMEDDNFMEKYPLGRTRKERKRTQVQVEPRKPILQQNLSGYHAGALKQRGGEDSPYKDLRF